MAWERLSFFLVLLNKEEIAKEKCNDWKELQNYITAMNKGMKFFSAFKGVIDNIVTGENLIENFPAHK